MRAKSPISRRSFLTGAAATAGGVMLSSCTFHGRLFGDSRQLPTTNPGPRTTDHHPPTTVYSWSDANQRGIIPMTWQPMNETGPALFLRRPMPGAFAGDPADIIANGPRNIDRWADWMRRYFRRFNPPPKFIVLDEEGYPLSYWGLCDNVPTGEPRVNIFRKIWRDPAAYAVLPESVKQFGPEDFAIHTGRGHEAIIAWQKFVQPIKAKSLRRVVYEPAVEVFGDTIACGNYDDAGYDFVVYDINGWPRQGTSLMGNWSCPSCYLWNKGQRYRNQPKAVTWNNFIDSLNYVRSCLNRAANVAPWVSFPNFYESTVAVNPRQQVWLWVELIRHMKASGVTTFLYWNPKPPTQADEDALAARTFAEPIGRKADTSFEALPLNTETVRTGDCVTRYIDWQRAA